MKQKQKITSKALNYSIILYVFIIFFDQFSKFLIRTNLILDSSFNIGKILSFTYVRNTGISFGMLKGYNFAFALISFFALIVFGYYFLKEKDFRLAIVCAGITGNLVDRLFLGYVVDFINFHWWPIFNIADSAIFIGIFLLLIKKEDIKKR